MQKSLISLSIALSVVLFTSSCGNSNDSSYAKDFTIEESDSTLLADLENTQLEENISSNLSDIQTSSELITGTGYYVDSALDGISYACGLSTGTTDVNGTFIFEEGKDCSFSVAGVTLRTTKAKDLRDGQKIVEDSFEVARFLQSIDIDGTPENGIQITKKTIDAVIKALEENDSIAKIPTDSQLEAVVTSVENDVKEFNGRVKTQNEVNLHLKNTKTNITKTILIGQTLYLNDYAIKFNDDGSFLFIKENGAEESLSYSIDGDLICDEDGCSKLISYSDSNISFEEEDGEIFTLYYTKEDAKENFNESISGSTVSTANSTAMSDSNSSSDEITEYYYDENGKMVSTCTYSQYSASCKSFTELLDTYYDENGNVVEMYLECDEENQTDTAPIKDEANDYSLTAEEKLIAEQDLLEVTEPLIEPESDISIDGNKYLKAKDECRAFNNIKHTENKDNISLIKDYEYRVIENQDGQVWILIDYIAQGDVRHRWVDRDCFY